MTPSEIIEGVSEKLREPVSEYRDIFALMKREFSTSNISNVSSRVLEIINSCRDSVPLDTQFTDVKLPNKELIIFSEKVNITDRGLYGLLSIHENGKILIVGITLDDLGRIRFNAEFSFPIDTSLQAYIDFLTEDLYLKDNPTNHQISGYEKTKKEVIEICKFYLCLLSWREQKLINSIETPIERHVRKRIKSHRMYYEVIIRPLEPRDKQFQYEESPYTCRWIVSGHFRRQFYPSTNSHKLIFISPYIKGPDDAPMKEKSLASIRIERGV